METLVSSQQIALDLAASDPMEFFDNDDCNNNEDEFWFQPVGSNWQPFLPGSILPRGSLVVVSVSVQWGMTPIVLARFDPVKLLFGIKMGEHETIAPAHNLGPMHCQIFGEEICDEGCTRPMLLQIGKRISFKSLVLTDGNVPTLSLRKSRIERAKNTVSPSSSGAVWFQQVQNNWQPFLPGSVIPGHSFLVDWVGQKLGKAPCVMLTSDPVQLLVGTGALPRGVAPTHLCLQCLIAYEEMMEGNIERPVSLQIGEPLVHQSVVLDLPSNKKILNPCNSMQPTLLSIRQSCVQDTLESAGQDNTTNPWENDDNNDYPMDDDSTNYPTEKDNGNSQSDSCKESDSIFENAVNHLDSQTVLDECVPRLSAMRHEHQSAGGHTLEMPFSFSQLNRKQNRRGETPVERPAENRTHNHQGNVQNRSAPATHQEMVHHNWVNSIEEREKNAKAKEEDDQRNAKERWRFLFGEGHCPLEIQEEQLQKMGLSSGSFESLTDPSKKVNGEVIDRFFKLLGSDGPPGNGYLSSLVVPTFLGHNNDRKIDIVLQRDGACLSHKCVNDVL